VPSTLETGFAGGAHAAFETIGQGIAEAVDAVDATDAHAFLRCFTGTKPRMSSRQIGLPPRCEARWTTGL
jgi:hypothetical protein